MGHSPADPPHCSRRSLWTRGLLAGAIVWPVCLAIGALAQQWTGVPAGFPPFTFLPLTAACWGGALLGTLVYGLLCRFCPHPKRWMWLLGTLVIALSLYLPYRLSYTQSQRFAGVTPSAQLVLVVMHLVVGGTVIGLLTGPRRSGPIG
jgi:hypothetical protein